MDAITAKQVNQLVADVFAGLSRDIRKMSDDAYRVAANYGFANRPEDSLCSQARAAALCDMADALALHSENAAEKAKEADRADGNDFDGGYPVGAVRHG